MKKFEMGLVGVATAALISFAVPSLTSNAEAHSRGALCRYQSIHGQASEPREQPSRTRKTDQAQRHLHETTH